MINACNPRSLEADPLLDNIQHAHVGYVDSELRCPESKEPSMTSNSKCGCKAPSMAAWATCSTTSPDLKTQLLHQKNSRRMWQEI